MKQFRIKLKVWFFTMWRPILVFLGVCLIVGSIFGFQLGTLTHGASTNEQAYISGISSGKELLKNPVYIAHRLPIYVLFKLHVHNLVPYRAVSAVFATLAVASCLFILKEWYTDRVAILGTWLFLTSAWILHIGRLATPEVSYLLLFPLLWAVVWLYNTTLRRTALLLLSILGAMSLYLPGCAWILVVAVLWKYKLLWKEIKHVPWWFRTTIAIAALVVISPLLWSALTNTHILAVAAGLPDRLPHLKEIGQNFVNIFDNLLFRGPTDPIKWLGRLPLLDAFSSVMLVMGVYSLRYHLKRTRIQLIGASSLVLGILICLGGPVTITALLPVVYILIAAGMAFMLQQWFMVFPNNPLARGLATTLMSIVVLLVSYYHVNHYYIAWPQTPATKAAFNKTLVK